MTRDDIIRMARKAGFMPVTENPDPEGGGWYECFEQEIEYFASLVAAAERERLLSTEIHSCHANCERFACVQTRKAVEAAAAAERQKVAAWMIERSYATGHGDTTEDLLKELEWQIAENWTRGMVNGVQAEREACAKVCGEMFSHGALDIADAIRARGEKE
jgi:hypothetical protein